MKKFVIALLCLVSATALLAACKDKKESESLPDWMYSSGSAGASSSYLESEDDESNWTPWIPIPLG